MSRGERGHAGGTGAHTASSLRLEPELEPGPISPRSVEATLAARAVTSNYVHKFALVGLRGATRAGAGVETGRSRAS
jgi:hypothetical protein